MAHGLLSPGSASKERAQESREPRRGCFERGRHGAWPRNVERPLEACCPRARTPRRSWAEPFGTISALPFPLGGERVKTAELGRLVHEARRKDDASFLAERPGPWLLLMGPSRSRLESAVVVPLGTAPWLTTLGRHPENDIVAPWPSVSRRHAVVLLGEGGAWLLDRGSANGTFLIEERLLPDLPRELHDGDELRFGTELRAVYLTSRGLLDRVRRIAAAA